VLSEKDLEVVLQVGELLHLRVRRPPHLVHHGGNFRVALCEGKLLQRWDWLRVSLKRAGGMDKLHLLLILLRRRLGKGGARLIRRRCGRGGALVGISSRVFGKVINVDDVLGIRLGGRGGLGRNLDLRCNGDGSRRWLDLLLEGSWGLGGLASGTSVKEKSKATK
jgi:hypothetical protein